VKDFMQQDSCNNFNRNIVVMFVVLAVAWLHAISYGCFVSFRLAG